jgi:hypothetical protein
MTEYGRCPAFGYECEYVAKVEAQAAEIERLREALRQIANIIPPIQTTIARAALGDTK